MNIKLNTISFANLNEGHLLTLRPPVPIFQYNPTVKNTMNMEYPRTLYCYHCCHIIPSPNTKHPLRNHGLAGNFHIIGIIWGVFSIRGMGLLYNIAT